MAAPPSRADPLNLTSLSLSPPSLSFLSPSQEKLLKVGINPGELYHLFSVVSSSLSLSTSHHVAHGCKRKRGRRKNGRHHPESLGLFFFLCRCGFFSLLLIGYDEKPEKHTIYPSTAAAVFCTAGIGMRRTRREVVALLCFAAKRRKILLLFMSPPASSSSSSSLLDPSSSFLLLSGTVADPRLISNF